MKLLKSKLFFLGMMSIILFNACKDDDEDPATPTPPTNEEEVITSVTLTFKNAADTTQTFTANFKDPDGDGGNDPTVFDSIILATNTTYLVSITLLDESDPNDVEDITEEIEEEDDEHLFCFTPSGTDITIQRTDSDGTYEVGLASSWQTGGTAGTGTVQVTLKHQPGVKDGTCAPGESDIELNFPTRLQ